MSVQFLRDPVVLIAVSFFLGAGILLTFRRWYLALIPLLPYSGVWVIGLGLTKEWFFAPSYIEFIIMGYFCVRWLLGPKDALSRWIFFTALVALPSFIHAAPHFLVSLFIFVFLLGSAGVYKAWTDEMPAMLARNVVDITVMVWVLLGLGIKFYDGMILDQSPVLVRSGGILGSNHVAGILFLLLPLVKRRWVGMLGFLFLCSQFSRGIFLCVAVFLTVWFLFVRMRQAVGILLVVVGMVVGVLYQFRDEVVFDGQHETTIGAFMRNRLRFENEEYNLGDVYRGIVSDSRREIFSAASDISRSSRYLGIGLGGFYWGLERIGFHREYSNAHNVYLTSFVEGGVLFAIGLAGFLGWLLWWSFRYHRPAFVGLITWCLYGFFSGEIYEMGGAATGGDYYTLMFVAAAVAFERREVLRVEKVPAGDPS